MVSPSSELARKKGVLLSNSLPPLPSIQGFSDPKVIDGRALGNLKRSEQDYQLWQGTSCSIHMVLSALHGLPEADYPLLQPRDQQAGSPAQAHLVVEGHPRPSPGQQSEQHPGPAPAAQIV